MLPIFDAGFELKLGMTSYMTIIIVDDEFLVSTMETITCHKTPELDLGQN